MTDDKRINARILAAIGQMPYGALVTCKPPEKDHKYTATPEFVAAYLEELGEVLRGVAEGATKTERELTERRQDDASLSRFFGRIAAGRTL